MSLDTWLWFCATEAVLSLSPGPSVLMVVSLSLTRGAGPGLRASLGVLAANVFYFALVASGVGALISTSSELFGALKLLGAGYLVWIGVATIARASRAADPEPEGASPAAAVGRPFRHGLVTQGSNANLLIYFSALLPQFIDPAAPLAGQVAILAATSVAIELAVLAGYALVSARAGRMARPGFGAPLRRLGGALLIAAGARLALRSEP